MARDKLILNRYRPIAEAGTGGFGAVRVAWDTRIQRKVAIKCIELDEADAMRAALPGADAVAHPGLPVWDEERGFLADSSGEGPRTREDGDDFFAGQNPVRSLVHLPGLDEARTAAMLTDSNIVAVYDFEVQDCTAYLIMEYIEGITLSTLLRNYGDYLTLDIAAAVFSSIAHALEVAHDNQVLHLDIKPDNVLINRQGQVKVTDFGLATLADASGFGAAGGGTIGYMPLEQMRGQSLDVRCDEWALASVIYEMLTGENPFLASDLTHAEGAIEDAELVLPSLCWDDLDAAIDDVVFYALDPDREERYATVADFAEEMEPFLGNVKQGHRELAVIVGDAQDDDVQEGEDEESFAPRIPLRDRLGPRQMAIAAHIVGAAGSALVAFIALANLPQIGGWAGSSGPLFWGLFALVALAGAFKPHLGALLSFFMLSGALIAQNAPALGCVLLAATAAWWYGIGRMGDAEANVALTAPLAGAVGFGQLVPFVAGFCLTPLKALGSTTFALFVTMVLASFGSGNLLGWDALLFWDFSALDVQERLGALLMQPATWCIVGSWLGASGVLSLCHLRSTRVLAVLGVCLAAAVLLVGACGAAWFASDFVTWTPSVAALASTMLATVVMLVVAAGRTPYPAAAQNSPRDS